MVQGGDRDRTTNTHSHALGTFNSMRTRQQRWGGQRRRDRQHFKLRPCPPTSVAAVLHTNMIEAKSKLDDCDANQRDEGRMNSKSGGSERSGKERVRERGRERERERNKAE